MKSGVSLPEKISRIVLQYSNMILKLNVKIKNDNGTFHNEFAYGDKKYININVSSYLTLEIPKTEDNKEFDPSKSFMIGLGNIGNVVKRMKKVLNNIYKEDIFAIQNNKIIAYDDMVKKYTEQINIPRLGQALLIRPSVIYDENETTYEGVNIYINKSYNVVSLSIDEFENFVYILENIDLMSYSQLIVNYYMLYLNTDINSLSPKKNSVQNLKSIDWFDNKPKVQSNYRKEEPDNTFEGL